MPLYMRSIGPSLVLALGLLGCSVRPLPEGVSRASTFDIVERIRCEVLDGLKEGLRDVSTDARRRAKATAIIDATYIGYDFDFIIAEHSSAGSGRLEFKRAGSIGDEKGLFLDLKAAASTRRSNTRAFRVVDKLSALSAERLEQCATATTVANGLYPIAGSTGMGEVVRTYIKLEMLTDLGEGKAADEGQIEVFSDELDFTTKLSVGVSPTLELNSVAGRFRLSHLSVTGAASRSDVHKVTVALARRPGDLDPKEVLETVQDLHQLYSTRQVIRPFRTLKRVKARQVAGPETRVLLELQRRRNIREDERIVARVLFGTE